MRALPAFLCFLVLGAPLPSQPPVKPQHPTRSGPEFATIYRADPEKKFLDCRFVDSEAAPGTNLGKRVYTPHLRRDFAPAFKVYDARGAQLTEKQYWGRLREGALVLVFWNELDPYYLRILRADGVALVLPSVSSVLGPIPE
jgi:hypothetical protein